jgi:hypothetical protein
MVSSNMAAWELSKIKVLVEKSAILKLNVRDVQLPCWMTPDGI